MGLQFFADQYVPIAVIEDLCNTDYEVRHL